MGLGIFCFWRKTNKLYWFFSFFFFSLRLKFHSKKKKKKITFSMCPAVVNCRRRIRNINQFERLLLFFFFKFSSERICLVQQLFHQFCFGYPSKTETKFGSFLLYRRWKLCNWNFPFLLLLLLCLWRYVVCPGSITKQLSSFVFSSPHKYVYTRFMYTLVAQRPPHMYEYSSQRYIPLPSLSSSNSIRCVCK